MRDVQYPPCTKGFVHKTWRANVRVAADGTPGPDVIFRRHQNIRAGRSPASYFSFVVANLHSLFGLGTIQFLVVLYSCGVIYYIYSACIVCTQQSSRYDDFPTHLRVSRTSRSFSTSLVFKLSASQRQPQATSARERHTI